MVFKLHDLLACVVVSKTPCYFSNCSWSTEKLRVRAKKDSSQRLTFYILTNFSSHKAKTTRFNLLTSIISILSPWYHTNFFLQTSSGRKHPGQSLPCCHHFQTFVAVIFSLDISPYSYGAIVYKVVNTKKQTVNSTPFQLRASDLGSFFSKVTTQNSVGIGSEEGRINLILTGSC